MVGTLSDFKNAAVMLCRITLKLINQYLENFTQFLICITGTNCENLKMILGCNSEIWCHECAYPGNLFSQMITRIASFRN